VASEGEVGLPGEKPGELNSTLVPCRNDTLWDDDSPSVAFPLLEIQVQVKMSSKINSNTHNGRFLMMYHEPTAAPMSTRIKIGMKTAAVLLPPAECVRPRDFSQFLPAKSVPQSQTNSPSLDSLQKPPFSHVQTLGRALGRSATDERMRFD
jgi:hypothetical protein